jgi:hypothetical protein
MAGVAKALRLDDKPAGDSRGSVASRPLPQKVHALLTKANYQPPKVVSFPIDGMDVSPLTLTANTTG